MKLTINGGEHDLKDIDPEMPLLWAIRDVIEWKGTKFDCGAALCGACTVHANGKLIRSCITPVASAVGVKITTIEAISGRIADVVKAAWIQNGKPLPDGTY